MDWEVSQSPAYSLLKVRLKPGESITAEAGSFISGFGDYEVKTHTGGIMAGIARRVLGGEAIFLNTFTSRSSSELWFAPSLPGDIEYRELNGKLIIQDFSYLAHHGDIRISVEWRGLKGLLAEGELVWVKAEGRGGVWMNAYGGIEVVELKEGEVITVDNFHFVAMDPSIRYSIRKFGGWKSFILGGEGIVAELRGPGKVYLQTRSLPPFVNFIRRFLPR
ncbi:TPA: TIGR00266 family protein [Candidatus Geothermarchaeota archaeon]|nr:TIGR00266 family protein [Candidatus Geothermarchaeota archaeon]